MKPEMFLKPAPVLLVILQKVVLVLHLPNLNINTKVWTLLQMQIQKEMQKIPVYFMYLFFLYDVFSLCTIHCTLQEKTCLKTPNHKLAHGRVFLNVFAHILWFSSLHRVCTKIMTREKVFRTNWNVDKGHRNL